MSGDIFIVEVGEPICIPTGIVSGATPVAGKFPRVDLCDKGGTSIGGPIGFTDVGGGKYWATFTPQAEGVYSGFVHFFDDAAYTAPTVGVTSQFICVMVKDTAKAVLDKLYCNHVQDGTVGQAIAGAALHAGVNSALDNTGSAGHNVNNNMTSGRRSLFPNRASAIAQVEGTQCLTITLGSVSFDPGNQSTAAEVVKTAKWITG